MGRDLLVRPPSPPLPEGWDVIEEEGLYLVAAPLLRWRGPCPVILPVDHPCMFDSLPPGTYGLVCPCPRCSPQCSVL